MGSALKGEQKRYTCQIKIVITMGGGGGGCKGESTSIRVSRRSTCFKINKEL